MDKQERINILERAFNTQDEMHKRNTELLKAEIKLNMEKEILKR